VITQAMLAALFEEFIRKVVALLPHPDRPAPPPWPEPLPPVGDKTLAQVRDAGMQTYSGYPVHCAAIQTTHDQLLRAVIGTVSGGGSMPPGGMAAIMGKWPGNETDEEIEAALKAVE
jgi:hypothetical protein